MMNKKILSFCAALMCLGTAAAAEWEDKSVFEVNREPMKATFVHYGSLRPAMAYGTPTDYVMSLNGTWKFNYSHTSAAAPQDFYKESYDVSRWNDIKVPGPWEMQGFGTPIYTNTEYPYKMEPPYIRDAYGNGDPVGSYRTEFTVPAGWSGREVFITLGGISSAYYIWVNGQKVGYAEDTFLPSEFDITPYLKEGANTLALQVHRWSDGAYLEDQDGWRMSGIFRDVYIHSTPKTFIRDFAVKTDLDASYRDAVLTIDADIKNMAAKAASGYTLEALLLDGAGQVAKMDVKMPKISKNETGTVALTSNISDPKKWTSETPNLYTVVLALKDSKGNVVDAVNTRIGFRKIEIRDRVFLLNGQPIKMKGVNRAAHDPFYGKAIPRERTLAEVRVMKANNINSVRTAHMPAEEYFYDLCDEYGIMIIGEANMETHGFGYGPESRAHDTEWTDAHVSRITRMVKRDKNHPSVVQWSLGNEAGNGVNMRAMYLAAKELDPSRPVQYHFDDEPISSDILGGGISRNGQRNPSGRYLMLEDMQKVVDSSDPRPFLMNEYAHAMGNGMGNLAEYIEMIEKHDMLTGAMIWDWNDQSIVRNIKDHSEYGMLVKDFRFALAECHKPDGTYQWVYGGDFGDRPNAGNFSNNGIVPPDLSDNPKLTEVRRVYQDVDFKNLDIRTGEFEVFNKFYFKDLSEYDLVWEVLEDGVPVKKGNYGTVNAGPRETVKVLLPIASTQTKPGKEYIVTVALVNKRANLWSEAGDEAAWNQLTVIPWDFTAQVDSFENGKPAAADNGDILTINSNGYEIVFDKLKGKIAEVRYGGAQVVRSGPELSFWRAPIDNDGTGRNARYEEGQLTDGRGGRLTRTWDAAGYPSMPVEVKSVDYSEVNGTAVVTVEKFLRSKIEGAGFEVTETYRINDKGQVLLASDIRPVGDLPEVARVGYEVEISEQYGEFSWYGRGPFEGYIDRHRGERFGAYSGTVEDQFYNYIYPQETGNKYDVRWAKLVDNAGRGVAVSGDGPLQVAVRKYTNMNIAEAEHPDKLRKLDYTILNVNHLMAPIGNESCGPRPIEDYVLYPENWKFDVLFDFAGR